MAAAPEEWLEGQADRILGRQRAQADNAKLVATFAAGIAAALVASALQAGSKPSGWDWAAAIALGVTVVLTGAVLFFDRIFEPDHESVIDEAENDQRADRPWTDAYLLYRLRKAAMKAADKNQRVLRLIAHALWPQLLGALFTGAAAAISMLQG